MINNKKAASPYVAYIMLIGMAVAIAAFGYKFINDYSMEKAKEVETKVFDYLNCDDINIEILDICQDSSYIYFTMENTGYDDIQGIYVNLYYVNMETSNSINKGLVLPMERWDYKILKLNMIEGLDITPMLGNVGNRNICSNRINKFSDIAYCQD